MLIVGFGNKARHGKDTAGEAVVDFYEQEMVRIQKCYGRKANSPFVKQYKFADALYREARLYHGMTVKDAPLLQRIGAHRRSRNENYWVDQVAKSIGEDKPDIAVITDLRYRNEASYIADNGGITVNVSRLNADGSPYVADDRPADHPSETELDGYNFDYYIKTRTGDAALVGQQAILIVQFDLARRP
jgi:hypothetical protein